MSAALTSVISSAQSIIECDKDVVLFLDANRDEIRRKLMEKLPELGYHGKYRLLTGFNEELLDENTEHSEVFLVLDGDLEHDEEAMSKALSPIFAPHTTVLCMKSQIRDLIAPCELEGLSSDDVQQSSPEPADQLANAGQPQSRQVTQVTSYDSTLQPAVDKKPELKLSFDPQLFIATKLECTFGMKLEITIKSNHCGEGRPIGIRRCIAFGDPWCYLEFNELTIWSKNNGQFSISSLHLPIEVDPLTTGCEILSPDLKHPTTGEESTFDQWSIGTITYKRSGRSGVQEARIVEMDYMAHNNTRASRSVTHQLPLDEEYRPRVLFFSPTTSGRSLRISLKSFWTSNSTNNSNQELHQTPILFNFFHQASFEINLEDLIRNKEFGEKHIQLAPLTHTLTEAIQDAIDEANTHEDVMLASRF